MLSTRGSHRRGPVSRGEDSDKSYVDPFVPQRVREFLRGTLVSNQPLNILDWADAKNAPPAKLRRVGDDCHFLRDLHHQAVQLSFQHVGTKRAASKATSVHGEKSTVRMQVAKHGFGLRHDK